MASKRGTEMNQRDILRAMSLAQLLFDVLVVREPGTQRMIAREIGRRRDPKALDRLAWLLESSSEPRVLGGTIDAIAETGTDDAHRARLGKALCRLVEDKKMPVSVRDSAAYALASVRDPSSANVLVRALADENRTIRICAAAALASLRDPETQPAVRGALSVEQDLSVREALGKALETIPGSLGIRAAEGSSGLQAMPVSVSLRPGAAPVMLVPRNPAQPASNPVRRTGPGAP